LDLKDARELAVGLMARHRLTGWRLVFDNAKTRAGACHSDRREIALSRPLMSLYSREQVTETVLHGRSPHDRPPPAGSRTVVPGVLSSVRRVRPLHLDPSGPPGGDGPPL
jgi:hypothetical protein